MTVSTFPPKFGPETDLLVNVERGRVVYADGWLYVRPGIAGVYAQHVSTVSVPGLDADPLPCIYRRAVGWPTWSELTGSAVTHVDAREAQHALYAFGERLAEMVDGYGTAALWADCMPPYPNPCPNCLGTGRVETAVSGSRCTECMGDGQGPDETGGRVHLALDADALDHYRRECAAFLAEHWDALASYCERMGPWTGTDDRGQVTDPPMARAGHDLWLTRGGHGAGFRDRGLEELGERLADAASKLGEDDAPTDNGDGETAGLC